MQTTKLEIIAKSGTLEIAIDYPQKDTKKDIAMIICHPHPQFLGTMDNKVVTTLSKSAREVGIKAYRFNYRGVGKSSGVYDNGHGEVDDLFSVIDYVKKQNSNIKIIIAGFSFGGVVAYKGLNNDAAIIALITIAPSFINFSIAEYPQPSCPWLIIHGSKDDIVNQTDVLNILNNNISSGYQYEKMIDAGHFFHGRLLDLKSSVVSFLNHKI